MLDYKVTNLTGKMLTLPSGEISLYPHEQRVISTLVVPVRELIRLSEKGLIVIDEIFATVGGQKYIDYTVQPDVCVRNIYRDSVRFVLEQIGHKIVVDPNEERWISTYEVPFKEIMLLVEHNVLELLAIKSSVGGVPLPYDLTNVPGGVYRATPRSLVYHGAGLFETPEYFHEQSLLVWREGLLIAQSSVNRIDIVDDKHFKFYLANTLKEDTIVSCYYTIKAAA